MKGKLAIDIVVLGVVVPRLSAQNGDAATTYCGAHPFDSSRCVPPAPFPNGGTTPAVPLRQTAPFPSVAVTWPTSTPSTTPIIDTTPKAEEPAYKTYGGSMHIKDYTDDPRPAPQPYQYTPPAPATRQQVQSADDDQPGNSDYSVVNLLRRKHYCAKHHGGRWRNPSGSITACR